MGKYKVIVTARSFGKGNREPFTILEESGCAVMKYSNDRPLSSDELIPLIDSADAIIVGNDQVDSKVISAGKRLKVISRYGVGYDNIDLNAAKERSIVVTNTPDTNTNSVADLAFALILSLERSIPVVSNMVKDGGWERILGTEVWGKTLGVIGLGRIGKGLVKRAKGFNMNIFCYDIYPDNAFARQYGVNYCTLEELLRKSDMISIHLPLLPSTKELIGEKELSMMKSTAIIVNTSRGGIIKEDSLYKALSNKMIAGAALDVMENEPPKDNPLLKLDNVIITSHIGGYTAEAVRNMGITAAKNVTLILNGKPGAFIVYA